MSNTESNNNNNNKDLTASTIENTITIEDTVMNVIESENKNVNVERKGVSSDINDNHDNHDTRTHKGEDNMHNNNQINVKNSNEDDNNDNNETEDQITTSKQKAAEAKTHTQVDNIINIDQPPSSLLIPEEKCKKLIDELAPLIAEKGQEYENLVKRREVHSPAYAFFRPWNLNHPYYEWRCQLEMKKMVCVCVREAVCSVCVCCVVLFFLRYLFCNVIRLFYICVVVTYEYVIV